MRRFLAFSLPVLFLLATVTAAGTDVANAYPVAPALSLAELYEQSDLVCKVVAVSTQPVDDDWFEAVRGFKPSTTELKIVAVYKSQLNKEQIAFHHYAVNSEEEGFFYMPQHYEFETGRTYIVFAKATADGAVFRQLWKNHRSQEDQGLLLAAGNDPRAGLSIKEIVWQELTGLLESQRPKEVMYGLAHLDLLSGGGYPDLHDLDRRAVLQAVQPLFSHGDPEVVRQAIEVTGSQNPYLSPGHAQFWLATVGGGHLPGLGQWDRNKKNLGGELYWKELVAVADGDGPVEARALAIRALGRAPRQEVRACLDRWMASREPAIRQAATVLLADYADEAGRELVKKSAADADPAVRAGAAHAIGFGQMANLVPLLGNLCRDADPQVVSAAAMSLLSFPLRDSGDVLRADLNHPQFRPLFVNALAREAPENYLDQLAENVERAPEIDGWWGGQVPWGVSWEILFFYAQRQTPERLASGDLNKVLDALEAPISGRPGSPSYYSSSEPRDLYALYVQRGLKDRAGKFRAACKKGLSYDIDYFFKMVDEDPSLYQRR